MSSSESIRDYALREDETRGNLIIVLSPAGLLLGMKTRGFGAGKLVLPGGKEKFQGPGFFGKRQTVADIQDELHEETGISLPAEAFMGVGYLYIDPGVGEPRDIVIAKTTLPHIPLTVESDELMDQAWYPTDDLPYDKMPSDYNLWLPGALDGHLITAFLRNIDTDFRGSKVFGSPMNPENGRTTTLAHVE